MRPTYETRKLLVVRIVSCFLASAILGGCMVLPQNLPDKRPFRNEDLAFIEKGVTSKSAVIGKLGFPAMTYFDDSWWKYTARQGRTDWTWVYWIPGWTKFEDPEVGRTINRGSRRFYLLLHFNQDETIREITIVNEDSPCNQDRTICLESDKLVLKNLSGDGLSISAGETPLVGIEVDQSDELDLIKLGGIVYERENDEPYTGTATKMHDDGWIERTVHYENGVLNGAKTIWYANGQKRYEAWYVDGHRHGLITFWDVDGSNPRSKCYQNDRVATMNYCQQ